jgi:hypothetical protein
MEAERETCWKKFAAVTVRLPRLKAKITLGALLL